MRYDLYYIKHRSFLLDVRILLDTARVVLLGRGAESVESPSGEAREYDRVAALLPHLLLRRDTGRALALHGAATPLAFRDDFRRRTGERRS